MKKVLILPVLAAALLTAACGDDSNDTTTPPIVDTRPGVRFLNAMTGMTSSGGFTTNGQFVTGSALTFGQSTCSRLDAGLTTFAFGAANTGGTALNGNALAALPNESVTAGGDYIVAAIGNGVHSILYMLNNSFSGTLGNNQAAVRFVNLAATADSFTVKTGATVHAPKLGEGAVSTFATVASGSNAFSISQDEDIVLSGTAATLNLQSGTVNTVAIVHDGALGAGFRLIPLPRCT